VGVMDANGNVKDQATLMQDIAKKYQTFGSATERVDFLTNIFGKSGAGLVDVFDTLAQEGGIDKVSDKVKQLGLDIDPDQYEQFTRSLQELKLAGTGLAVQFTNALMPSFEKVLKWAQQFQGMTPEQIFFRIGELASDLPAKFEAWSKNINWEEVSQDLISGIRNIDWNGIGNWVGESSSHIWDGLVNAFQSVDWVQLFTEISIAFMEFSTGLVGSDLESFRNQWMDNWRMAKEIVVFFVDQSKAHMLSWLIPLPYLVGSFFAQMYINIKSWLDRMVASIYDMVNNARSAILDGLSGIADSIYGYFENAYNNLKYWIDKMLSILNILANAISGAGTKGGKSTSFEAQSMADGQTWMNGSLSNFSATQNVNYGNQSQQTRKADTQPVQAYIDYDELARTMARVLGSQMQRA